MFNFLNQLSCVGSVVYFLGTGAFQFLILLLYLHSAHTQYLGICVLFFFSLLWILDTWEYAELVSMHSATVTPYYLPDDVDFESLVRQAFKNERDELSLAFDTSSPLSSVPSSPETQPGVPPKTMLSPIAPEGLTLTNSTKVPSKASASVGKKS
uniref:Uncharacterized protein n=1 Tax=Moniliophthora roreri TaxID=221103 RepID=A0A0W0F3P0_MONRR